MDASVVSSSTVDSSGESLDVLACAAPALPALAGFAAVEVSLNGKDFTRSGLVFEYGTYCGLWRWNWRAVLTRGRSLHVQWRLPWHGPHPLQSARLAARFLQCVQPCVYFSCVPCLTLAVA